MGINKRDMKDCHYVIRVKRADQWLQLDFHDGSEVIYVGKFTEAITFENSDDAELFLLDHGLEKEDYDLWQLKILVSKQKR